MHQNLNIKQDKEDRMAKKAMTKKVEEVVEEIVLKRYYVDFYINNEPIAKDELVGTIFYSDKSKSIEIENIRPDWSSRIENFMNGDITFMDKAKQVFVSRVETPKDWILNLHKAVIIPQIYAGEVRTINETG